MYSVFSSGDLLTGATSLGGASDCRVGTVRGRAQITLSAKDFMVIHCPHWCDPICSLSESHQCGQYAVNSLYVESCVAELTRQRLCSLAISISCRTVLSWSAPASRRSSCRQPTRGDSVLDRVCVSVEPTALQYRACCQVS